MNKHRWRQLVVDLVAELNREKRGWAKLTITSKAGDYEVVVDMPASEPRIEVDKATNIMRQMTDDEAEALGLKAYAETYTA